MKKILEVKNYFKIVLIVSYKILEINSQEIDKKLRKENSEDYEKKNQENSLQFAERFPKLLTWGILEGCENPGKSDMILNLLLKELKFFIQFIYKISKKLLHELHDYF